MITPVIFKTKFPEFASIDDSAIQLVIDEAELILSESYWGNKYDLGLLYYCAHMLLISQAAENGNPGAFSPVSGRSVDGVSVSYSVGGGSPGENGAGFFDSTSYGQKYLYFRNALGVPACVI